MEGWVFTLDQPCVENGWKEIFEIEWNEMDSIMDLRIDKAFVSDYPRPDLKDRSINNPNLKEDLAFAFS